MLSLQSTWEKKMLDLETLISYSKNLQVLYVEDNPDTREMTLIILEDFFDNVITACDGVDGLEKFQHNNIDLIISDINMPNMDGMSMIKEIKAIEQDIPVLIFSAYNDAKHFIDAIKLGIDGYLIKPLDIEQFQQSLYKCISNLQIKREHQEYQKQLENKVQEQLEGLRYKDKLLLEQSKHAAMGEMIDIIAHQWKQPLNSIVMHASLIESSLDTLDPQTYKQEFQECYENLNNQVDTLLTTLDEFRGFFRPTNNLNEVSLQTIINSTLVLLKDELIKHQIELTYQCETGLNLHVNANDIKQLLINIITNAKEEMVKNNLPLEQRKINIHCYKKENEIIMEIKDSGNGIPENIIDNIFQMNFTTKEENGGTGIGLYMCSLICEKYGATIEAYNDNGAVFKITFKEI